MSSTATDRLNGITTNVAIKAPCKVAATSNVTLTGEQTISGTAVVAGDRVLLMGQTDTTENGIWVVSATSWSRAKDFDGNRDVVHGTLVSVAGRELYRVTTPNPIVIQTSEVTFERAGAEDAANVRYTPAGSGAVATDVQTKLREWVSAADFGTAGSESAIQAAIDYLATRGGGTVRVGAGVWSVATGLTVRNSNIAIIGEGYDVRHDTGSESSTTALRWTGAAGGTVLDIGPTEGPSAKKLIGVKVLGLAVQCEDLAERGLHVRSVAYGEFDLSGRNATAYLFDFGCATTLGESTDTQHCRVKLSGYQGGSTGIGFHVYGAGGGNFSYNQDIEVNIRHSTADGIVLDSCDNNTFKLLRAFRSSGSSTSVVLNGSDTVATCRANTFHRVSANGGLIARGTSSFANPSSHNLILDYDKENGIPDPTIEAGATLFWRGNLGLWVNQMSKDAVFANSLADAQAGLAAIEASAASFAMVASSEVLGKLMNAGRTVEWNLGLKNTAADVVLSPVSGASGAGLDIASTTAAFKLNGETVLTRTSKTWTPTISASSGTITTATASTARYERVGPFIFFTVAVTITDNGTGAGSLRITLPSAAAYSSAAQGVNTTNGRALIANVGPSSDVLSIQRYDGTYPVATGDGTRISGFYLAA